MPCLKPSLEQDGNLGPDAARARNRRSVSAARCAGCGGIGKDAGTSDIRRFRRCTGRLNATQPGVLAVSPSYIRGLAGAGKGSVAARQHSALFARGALRSRLTLRFYCGKRAALGGTEFVGGPRKSRVLLGCGLLCAAALLCAEPTGRKCGRGASRQARSRLPIFRSPPMCGWPATPSRPASFSTSTRRSTFRAFALADPYRVVVDIPQVSFQLAARHGKRGPRPDQGVPLRPGDAGRLADRVRSDGPGENRQGLRAGGRQRPAAAAGGRTRSGRSRHFVQSLSPESRPELRPAVAEAKRGCRDARRGRRSKTRRRRRIRAR